ncbi:MAG: S41 family peptidase [Proteobacteria bacterium]|nr:S41 family peptidase [Pseudomonadota bacterium]
MTLLRRHSRAYFTGFYGLAILLLAACAPMDNNPAAEKTIFSRIQATEVFTAGYNGVTDKYIEQVPTGVIALDGIRGLGAIDPGLTVSISDGMVVLLSDGREVARRSAPPSNDVQGWANLTTEIIIAAREASVELRTATMEAVYEAVFDGVLSNLDIFSRYAGADEAQQNRSKRDGFGGIGVRYRIVDGLPVLTEILPFTPADGAGLIKGDRLTHADGVPLKDLDRKSISKILRGPTQTRILLTLTRPGTSAPLTVALKRVHIFPVTITETIKDGIVSIKIKSFNQDTARSLAEKLEQVRTTLGDSMKGLVLDLRGNPGGLLKQSIKVADLLLTQGKIISTRGRHADSIHHYEAGGRDLAFGLPVVVLVDGKSASAAEIVAAALQDRDRAVVIGTASFGKGSVQTVLRLPNDGEITLTWSRLVAPSGYIFHGLGIRPAICTSNAKDSAQDTDMDKASEIIRQVLNNRSNTQDTLMAWRKPGRQDETNRARLRESCPSQPRRNQLEARVASQLINDPALFARTLNLTAAPHQAHY